MKSTYIIYECMLKQMMLFEVIMLPTKKQKLFQKTPNGRHGKPPIKFLLKDVDDITIIYILVIAFGGLQELECKIQVLINMAYFRHRTWRNLSKTVLGASSLSTRSNSIWSCFPSCQKRKTTNSPNKLQSLRTTEMANMANYLQWCIGALLSCYWVGGHIISPVSMHNLQNLGLSPLCCVVCYVAYFSLIQSYLSIFCFNFCVLFMSYSYEHSPV